MRRQLLGLIIFIAVAAGCGGNDTSANSTESSAGDVATTTVGPSDDTPSTAADPVASSTPSTTTPSTSAPSTTAATTPTDPNDDAANDRPHTVEEALALDRPLNIGHAGGDREWPHSTPYAFDQAARAGVDILEMDVLLTSDGVLVVQHDDTVDKTTEATGPVAELTLAELQALDNAYWFSPECWPCQDLEPESYIHRGVRTGVIDPPIGAVADDFSVPTFTDIAERFPDYVLDVEMKGDWPDAKPVAAALADAIEELDRSDSVIVAAFGDEMVAEFHRLAPAVATSPGLGEMTAWFTADGTIAEHHATLQVPPEYGDVEVVSAESVARAQADGFEVWVWPNTDEQERTPFYSELLDMGVDGIIAGRPTEMATAIAGNR